MVDVYAGAREYRKYRGVEVLGSVFILFISRTAMLYISAEIAGRHKAVRAAPYPFSKSGSFATTARAKSIKEVMQ